MSSVPTPQSVSHINIFCQWVSAKDWIEYKLKIKGIKWTATQKYNDQNNIFANFYI